MEKAVTSVAFRLFIILSFLLVPKVSDAEPRSQMIQLICGNELEHNATIFVPNFVTTMETISEQMRSRGFGVALTGTGLGSNYGLAQCYGDLSLLDCTLCYAEARTVLPQCFPFNGGRIYLDGCFMRFQNFSFYDQALGPEDRHVCGNRTRKSSMFQQNARRAVEQVVANALGNKGFARAEVAVPGLVNETAYVLADCWKTLSINSCRACLQKASASMLSCLPWSEARALYTGCFMRYSDVNFLNALARTGVSSLAKPGCEETCGNLTIPYPFGLSLNCSLNSWYLIKCDRTYNPPKPFLNSFLQAELQSEVKSFSLGNQTFTISFPVKSFCDDSSQGSSRIITTGTDLSGSPFYYSKDWNKLMLVGCGNGLVIQDKNVLSGCTSMCSKDTTLMGCFGINCCQSPVPFDLSFFKANFTKSGIQVAGPNCSAAFLVHKNWVPDQVAEPFNVLGHAPVVWLWTVQSKDLEAGLLCNKSNTSVTLENGTSLESSQCHCETEKQGNPYFSGGCQAIQGCIDCKNIEYYIKKTDTKVIILSVFGSVGVLLMLLGSYLMYKTFKKRRGKRRKQMFFKRNGGLLLRQQLSSNDGIVDKGKLFTAKELEKATDHFNENRILGRGGQGTVYKGMLPDGKIVAVKKSKLVDENQLGQFINEVAILSQINHRNVVKLLGCCLETEVPLLVYEFIINGTLYSFIHNENNEILFPWSTRLRIATEVAGALAYLHSATLIPIYHRDIKSSNILLDEKYRAKVSDFGTSRSIAIDQTHLTTGVQGTFGYLDPEYFRSSQFTEKSDVYSFGVVLAELLTGKKAVSTTTKTDRSLAMNFLLAMDENSLETILHAEILQEGKNEDVMEVANIAYRCLNLNGKNRPSMKEVTTALEAIRLSVPSVGVTNFELKKGDTSERTVTSEVNDTWTSTNNTISSDIYPLLFESS